VSHEIFNETMATYNRKPAWHGLGTVFTEPVSASEALRNIGADFQFTLEPLVAAVKNDEGKRTPLRIKDKVAIVRGPVLDKPAEVVGIASPTYEIIQNEEIASAMDNLTAVWPLETMGVLKRGETLFITLKVGTREFGSSTIEQYFLFTDTKTGKESAKFLFTPLRVECQNMLTAALSSATVSGTVVHRPGATREFTFRTDLMGKLLKAESTVMESFEAMTKAVLTVEQRDLIFQSYWPTPKTRAHMDLLQSISEDDSSLKPLRDMGMSAAEEFERLVNRSIVVHSELNKLYQKFNEEFSDHANTAWAAYNVCVEHADWNNATESTPYAALFGDRARRKRNAFSATAKVI
jgi:phage/plasmid-like protein (TIGR03299 family)